MAEAVGELFIRQDTAPPRRGRELAPIPAPKPQALAPRPALTRPFAEALETRRLFVLLPFALIAGQIAALQTSALPEPWLLATVAFVLAAALLASLRHLAALRLLTLALAFWTGFSLFPLHGLISGTPMLARPVFGTYQAQVDELLSEGQGERRVIISHIVPLEDARSPEVRRARLLIRGGPELMPGDTITGPIRFTPVPGPAVPGGFDGQFHAYFAGIGAYASTTKPPERSAGSASAPEAVIAGLRHAIATRIDAVLPQPAAGIARALINGDQSMITDEVREVMATAGIAHVYSVSGLHLTIVAGGVFFVLRFLAALAGPVTGRLPVKPVAAGFGILSALAYFAISGGNVAALRSTVMIVLVFLAVIAGRKALTMRNVALAALFIVLLDPASVFRPSFQLSFSAVVALVGAYELYRPARQSQSGPLRRLAAYLAGISVTSLVAGAATLVFSVYHFQQTSPLGVVGNLVTLPLVGAITMPAAAIATLLIPLGLEYFPLLVLGWSIERMLDLSALVAGWSAGLTASPLLTPMALLIALAALAWFAFLPGLLRLALPVLAVPLIMIFAMDHAPDVLISDTTQAVAVRGEAGLTLAAGKPGSFGVRVWEETFGGEIAPAAAPALRCDAFGCIAEGNAGFTVALVKQARALEEDCETADLVIARAVKVPATCRAPVIDAAALRRQGVTALYWDAAKRAFSVRPAIADAGRPWRVE